MKPKQWYVLQCKGGYIGNVFELFNNSPKRPRMTVTEDLQEAVIGTETMLRYWRRMGVEILGVESEPVPVRFEKDSKTKMTRTILDTRKDGHEQDRYAYSRAR